MILLSALLCGCTSSPGSQTTSSELLFGAEPSSTAVNLERLVDVDWTDRPADFAIDQLASKADVRIDVAWDELTRLRIDRRAVLTMRFEQTPARVVLERVLTKMDPSGLIPIDYRIDTEGRVVIATRELIDRDPIVRVYDLRHVISAKRNNAPQQTRDEAVADVLRLLRETIDFDTWSGRSWRSNADVDGVRVVITATYTQHREIEHLLYKLWLMG